MPLLKLGLITGEYPPMQGGVGAFTQELAKALAQLGHEVHIFTSRQARPPTHKPNWRDLLKPIDLGFAQLHPRGKRWNWSDVSLMADFVQEYNLELINIQYQAAAYNLHNPAINLAPWRLKGLVPTVVTFHDLRVPYLFPKAGGLRPWMIQWMCRQSHGVIVTNPEDYQSASQYRPKERTDNWLRLIPIGSNITVHPPTPQEIAQVRQALGLSTEAFLWGYFGFLHPSKGADTLIEALAKSQPNTHLVFMGGRTGSSDNRTNTLFLEQLQRQIDRLGLAEKVHWTEFMPDEQLSAYLCAADLMVMPYQDGVSLRRGSLMAVLAHGRPLITTLPQTVTPELIHGENVWFVPASDPPALAQAIQQLQNQPTLRQKLGQGASQVANLFNWDKIAAQTASFFQQTHTQR